MATAAPETSVFREMTSEWCCASGRRRVRCWRVGRRLRALLLLQPRVVVAHLLQPRRRASCPPAQFSNL